MKMRVPNNDSKESPEQEKGTLGDSDRICSLPDSILLHILSFMDTNDAVRTGTLSKSWRHLWTSVPNLNFVQSYRRNKDRCAYDANFNFVEAYVNFVDETLPCHVASNIHKFSLSFSYSKKYESHVNGWILFAASRGVQEIDLEFYGKEPYLLPSWLFTYDKLVSLKLHISVIQVPVSVHLSSLCVLSLSCIGLDDNLIKALLDGCPLHEDLAMAYCKCDGALCISSSNMRLKCLSIKDCCNNGVSGVGLEVQAPSIQILNLSEVIWKAEYHIKDVLSFSKTNLDLRFQLVDYNSRLILHSLLNDLRCSKVLNLSNYCIQVMSIPTLKYQPYIKVKCLILETGLQKKDLPGIANLLRLSFDLETLIIKLIPTYSSLDMKSIDKYNDGGYWEPLKFACSYMVPHLNTIKISGFMGRRCSSGAFFHKNNSLVVDNDIVRTFFEKQDKEIELVRFLLKNALSLKKMIINFCDKPDFVKVEEWPKIILMVAQKLTAIPRASSCAELLLSYK